MKEPRTREEAAVARAEERGAEGWGWGLVGQLGSRQSTGGFIAGKRHPLQATGRGQVMEAENPLGGSDEGSLEQPHGSSDKERASERGERK